MSENLLGKDEGKILKFKENIKRQTPRSKESARGKDPYPDIDSTKKINREDKN